MRLVTVLAVAAAATVMIGALLMAASVVLRHVTRHPPVPPPHLARIGLDVIAAGAVFGLVVLVLFAFGRLGRNRVAAATPPPAASPPSGRRPVLKPTNVYNPGGLIDVPRDGHAPDPPGGHPIPEILRDAGPGPGSYGPAAPASGGPSGGRGQDRPPPGWTGPPPRPGHQPGMSQGHPGQGPYVPGGAPVPPREQPPREHLRPREAPRDAPRPGYPMPGHQGMPRPQGMPQPGGMPHPGGMPRPENMPRPEGMPRPENMPGAGVPPREPASHRQQGPRPGPAGPPREPTPMRGPTGSGRPGGPPPPRDPGYAPRDPGHPLRDPGYPPRDHGHPPRDDGYPPRHGQGPGAAYGPGQVPGQGHGPGPGYGRPPGPGPRPGGRPGRHARGPGDAAAGHPGPGDPGAGSAAPGGRGTSGQYQGPSDPAGTFEGGYAQVIRASENPVRPPRRPGHARPQDPARTGSQPGEPPADVFVYRDTPDQETGGPDDPSYWYDLAGTAAAEETPDVPAETRGPFEPLVSSADPPGTVRAAAPDPEPSGPEDEAGRVQARKLEQIKDLYLTAEAIGEANVDKHFDHLLAQQRELIGEYFKQSSPPADEAPPADEVSQDARVIADQPRAW